MVNCIPWGRVWPTDVSIVDNTFCGSSERMASTKLTNGIIDAICQTFGSFELDEIVNGLDFSLKWNGSKCERFPERNPVAEKSLCVDCTDTLWFLLFPLTIIFGLASLTASSTMAMSLWKAIARERNYQKKDLYINLLNMSMGDMFQSIFVIVHGTITDLGYVYFVGDTPCAVIRAMLRFAALATHTFYFCIIVILLSETCDCCRRKCHDKHRKRMCYVFILVVVVLQGLCEYMVINDLPVFAWSFLFPLPFSTGSLWISTFWMFPNIVIILFSLILLIGIGYKVQFIWVEGLVGNILVKTTIFVAVYIITWTPLLIYYNVLRYQHTKSPIRISHRNRLSINTFFYLTCCFSGIGNFLTWMVYYKDIRHNMIINEPKPSFYQKFEDTSESIKTYQVKRSSNMPGTTSEFSNDWNNTFNEKQSPLTVLSKSFLFDRGIFSDPPKEIFLQRTPYPVYSF